MNSDINKENFSTADLCDTDYPHLHIAETLPWRWFGRKKHLCGKIATVKCFEDNSKVKEQLQEQGEGRVLVVDAGASQRRAHLGDQLAAQALNNGWAGVLVYGLIRDSAAINAMDLAVIALGTHPQKTEKRDEGQCDIVVHFAGIDFTPGAFLYADADGIIVSPEPLI